MIGLDTVNTTGVSCNETFRNPIEFYINFKDVNNCQMLVNGQYDDFYYMNSPYFHPTVNSTDFQPIKSKLSKPLNIGSNQCNTSFELSQPGLMGYNSTSSNRKKQIWKINFNVIESNNQADWFFRGLNLEVRIPWSLLGFIDPSNGIARQYFSGESTTYNTTKTSRIFVELVFVNSTGVVRNGGEFNNHFRSILILCRK